jgi:hypothetical protein
MRLRRAAGVAALALARLLATGCGSGAPPASTGASGTEQHQEFLQGVRAAQRMRSHGYPTWPDPTDQNGSNAQPIPAGIGMNSPQYQTAARTCGVSLPPGGG